MDRYMLALAIGGGAFMLFVAWCVASVMLMAHKEDPGCLDPRH